MTRLVFDASLAGFADVLLVRLPALARDEDFAVLTEEECARARRFVSDAGRSAFVTTRAALRRRLEEETGIAAASLNIRADAHGRPCLEWHDTRSMDFNVSHCHGMAAIAVARGGRIGVDIEAHGRVTDLREVVPQVMGERERALLLRLDGDAFLRAFYGSWTRKEAVVKAIGLGLSYPVATLDLPSDAPEFDVSVHTDPGGAWRVFTREIELALTLSVAITDAEEPPMGPQHDVAALAGRPR